MPSRILAKIFLRFQGQQGRFLTPQKQNSVKIVPGHTRVAAPDIILANKTHLGFGYR